jgi:DNA-binding transcriptional regulator LsrR (DeoR family)
MRETIDLALLARLRWKDGLKLEEIATSMGVSRPAVRRGLRKLRDFGAAVERL